MSGAPVVSPEFAIYQITCPALGKPQDKKEAQQAQRQTTITKFFHGCGRPVQVVGHIAVCPKELQNRKSYLTF
jgi:hypothetical protein